VVSWLWARGGIPIPSVASVRVRARPRSGVQVRVGWLARSVRKLVSLSDGPMSPSSRVMNSVHIYGAVIHHQGDL
jgi:hypothetical protein